MTTAIYEEEIYTKMIRKGSCFIDTLKLKDFHEMDKVLGGDCITVQLPLDILLWGLAANQLNQFEHTVTIVNNEGLEYLFGNVIITSNDDCNLNGIKDLSVQQLKWIRKNLTLGESKFHGSYIFNINARGVF